MKRKALSLILAFAMAVSLFTVGASAAEPTYGDTAGHWAEASIERWSGYGIIQGSNGKFDPNGQLTCAQLATILARLLKLPAAKDAGFSDNKADAWYYDAINRCAAAGILKGNGDGTVTPEAPITRERAMVMLARALGIEPLRNPDLTRYTDAAQVSAYAQGYLAALIEAGIVGGVTADRLAPQDNITRAATVTILDRAISTYADEAGETVKVDGKGIVLVVAENVKITGAPEGTKIVVADGATGLTVNGKSVSDNQTYIVPKTTTSSGSSSSGGHSHSYDATTHKCSCGAFDPAVVATIGNTNGYLTLKEAVTAATNGQTVKLVKDCSGNGIKIASGTVTIDLNGKTYTVDSMTVGSTGTETNAFQFLKGSTVTIKNGKMGVTSDLRCAYYFQNYANLTLENVEIIIDNCGPCEAAVHTMNGVVNIMGNTSIKASGKYSWTENDTGDRKAIMVNDWRAGYVDGTQVTVDTTGVIEGNVLAGYYAEAGTPTTGKSNLRIINGTFNGTISQESTSGSSTATSLVIIGGRFNSNPSAYVADDYFALPNGDGTYTVVTADQITSGVTIQGIAGYEHSAFATVDDAFTTVKTDLEARCGLVEESMDEEQFKAFFTDDGKITWTIYGEQAVTDSRTFSFGRKANRFGEGRHITEINIIGGNDTAALNLSAVDGTFALPYNWWNVKDSANTALKCKNIKFNGIKSMPSGIYQCTLHPTTYEFDGCTFNGNLYSYQNFDVVMTIKNSTFNAPDTTTQYALCHKGQAVRLR